MSPLKNLGCCVVMAFSLSSQAVDLQEVVVGGIYYHNEWNSNDKVRVLAIRGSKVEVLYLEGSNVDEVDRVHPHELLTRTDSKEEATEDMVEAVALGVVAVAAIVCFASPETCEEKAVPEVNTHRLARSTSRNLYFRNNCSKPIDLALTFKDQASQWITNGWWNIQGNAGTYLAVDGSKLLTSGDHLYYYAKSDGNNLVWGGSDYTASFGERSLGMRKTALKVDSDGDFFYALHCKAQDALIGKHILGFSGTNLEFFDYKNKRYNYGVRVQTLVSGMPAEKAGLKAGDVIYDIDGKKVENIESLLAQINERPNPGAMIKLSYMRDSEIYSKTMKPAKHR